MEVVTLDQLKVHLSVEPDDFEQDDLLVGNLAAALRTIENRTGRTFAPGDYQIDALDLPAARQAALLMAGHFYRNRETVVTGTTATDLPMSVEYLITPFARIGI